MPTLLRRPVYTDNKAFPIGADELKPGVADLLPVQNLKEAYNAFLSPSIHIQKTLCNVKSHGQHLREGRLTSQ